MFFGEVTHIRVEPASLGTSQPISIFHAVYNNGDDEDFTLYELQCLDRHAHCDIAVGNVGYKFDKAFPLDGLVNGVYYTDSREGKLFFIGGDKFKIYNSLILSLQL